MAVSSLGVSGTPCLRQGEACALRWADIDSRAGVIVVRSQLVEVGGKAVEGKPKTRSGEDRRVNIGQRTIGALLARQPDAQGDAEPANWREGYTDHGRVFAREDGSDLTPSQATKMFTRLTNSAGLRQVRLHDLRHGAASLMLAGGADVYGHLWEGVRRQAADAAEALVRPRATTS